MTYQYKKEDETRLKKEFEAEVGRPPKLGELLVLVLAKRISKQEIPNERNKGD